MRTFLLLLFVTAALAVSGSAMAAPPSSSLGAGSSRYGRILFDGRGYVLYVFTRDPRAVSKCSGKCATSWPPFLVKHEPRALPGASAKLIGVARRSDGTLQATYAGRPLYYYVGDTSPGTILCQNVLEYGGYWLVVNRNGTPNRAKP